MYDLLKEICAANNWFFHYGRKDFHNLKHTGRKETSSNVFLDPVQIRDNDNDAGTTESKVHSGSFMFLYSSDIDEPGYEDRYEKYIKPIVQGYLQIIKDYLQCEQDVTVDLWQTVEVINVFDWNGDGVIVTYQLTIEEE